MTETIEAELGFAELCLRDEVVRAVADAGYTHPTPIQAQAVPQILAGHDLLGIAQTGTGKTAAFVLPMIHKLASGRARARMPRSVILSPTRELASQTADNFTKYGQHLSLSMALIIGGVGMGEQEKLLDRGVDVLIATPGRLLDWFERGKVLLGGVETFVIDEADRMLDMGFIPDVERLAGLFTRRPQTLLFSATMPKEVRGLADRFLQNPVEIAVTRPATASANVEAVFCAVNPKQKTEALQRLIDGFDVDTAIIFCNRKRDVGVTARKLQRAGYNARDLHGDLDQAQRQATLDAFKAGEVKFLVATDVAARGLDINDLPVVINFDVPTHADDYVHRIGRTGRAGRAGRAFTFTTADDDKRLAKITKLIGDELKHIDLYAEPASVEKPEPTPAAPEPAPAEPDAVMPPVKKHRSRPVEDEPRRRRSGGGRGRRREGEVEPPTGPIVGFGDAAPAFVLRPAFEPSGSDTKSSG